MKDFVIWYRAQNNLAFSSYVNTSQTITPNKCVKHANVHQNIENIFKMRMKFEKGKLCSFKNVTSMFIRYLNYNNTNDQFQRILSIVLKTQSMNFGWWVSSLYKLCHLLYLSENPIKIIVFSKKVSVSLISKKHSS